MFIISTLSIFLFMCVCYENENENEFSKLGDYSTNIIQVMYDCEALNGAARVYLASQMKN